MLSRRMFLKMSLAAGANLAFSGRNKEVINAFAKYSGSYAIPAVAAPYPTWMMWNKDLLTNPWVVKEDFTSAVQWTGTTGGTVTQNPDGGLAFTTTGGARANVYSRKTVALGVLAPALWRLRFKMKDDNCRSIDIYISTGTENDTFKANIGGQNLRTNKPRVGEWVEQDVSPAMWNVSSGSPNWANPVVQIGIRLYLIKGDTSAVLSSLSYGGACQRAVLFNFDDGFKSVWDEAYSYMQPLGLKGCAWIAKKNIDTPWGMSSANLREMDAAGWDVLNHTTNHPADLTVLTSVQRQNEWNTCAAFIAGLGITRGAGHLSVTSGKWNEAVIADADACGAIALRLGRRLKAVATPVADWNDVPYTFTMNNTTTTANVDTAINDCLTNHTLLIPVLHRITAAPSSSLYVSIAVFRYFCDRLIANGFTSITETELYRYCHD